MFTTQEYIKHFSNDEKRKAFIADHRSWGVWFTQPELGLTYYKHDLPDGARIVVEEYFRAPYSGENNGEQIYSFR